MAGMYIPVLPNFLYLDTNSLDEYLSVVEQGISDAATTRRAEDGAGANGRIEEEKVVRETVTQRFTRLMLALAADASRWHYKEVEDLNEDFEELSRGDFIHVEAEIEVPPTIRIFSGSQDPGNLFDLLNVMRPMAPLFGKNAEDLPGETETNAVRDIARMIKSDIVIVGDQAEDAAQLAGKLTKEYVQATPEGEVWIVGKVAKKWKEGESHHLLALPGASMVSRKEQRRAAQAPNTPQQSGDSVLFGPALTLDILAIYR